MRLDIHRLQGSAQAGARATVAALVREADAELKHLEAGGEDALHGFRVALRRLRSVTRALRPYLGTSVRKRHEKRLRAVARATAEARDAEVQLAWLLEERKRAGPRVAPAIDLLVRHLEQRQRESLERGSQARVASFHVLARKLAGRLAGLGGGEPGGAAPPFAAALAGLVRERAAELADALDAVAGPFEVEQGHSARIAAKRLRYLLEPLRGNPRTDAAAAVDALKELQDLLGELHDAHVAGDTIAAALVEAASERARQAHEAILAGDPGAQALRLARRDLLTRGLLALDRRAADRAGAAYECLVGEWLPARKAALVEAVAQVVGALAPHPASRAPAPRRHLPRKPAARLTRPSVDRRAAPPGDGRPGSRRTGGAGASRPAARERRPPPPRRDA